MNRRGFAARIASVAISRARETKRQTPKQLATKLSMPQSQILRIERHPDRTTIRSIQRIADAFGADVAKFLSKARH